MVKVLLVDDDLIYLDELSDGLRALRHDVTCSVSATEAQQFLSSGSFDIVICDTIMAGGGAVSLLHHVRERYKDLPFVVITGRPEIVDSPLFVNGMQDAQAKIEKSATLLDIDRVISSVLRQR